MDQTSTEPLKKTPLNARHRALGARMVPFGGWDMPVEYSGIVTEHLAVRSKAGLFDVSHMGEIEVAGKDALTAVQTVSTNDAAKLSVGQAQYSGLTTPTGTFVDDILVYRLAHDHFMLVVNAGEIEKKYRWIADHVKDVGDVAVVNSSSRYAMLAVQGPAALDIVQELTTVDLKSIKYYWFTNGEVGGIRSIISRTGYTGEDGVELFIPPQSAEKLWNTLLTAGAGAGLVPVGLGARDTLRLEAGMRLSGQDFDDTTSVLEADLGWIIGKNKKENFIGRDALERQKSEGLTRKLVGFEMTAAGIARHGYTAHAAGKSGHVTSGTQTPFLKKSIGLAYLPIEATAPGSEFDVDIRGRRTPARVVPLPFYKRVRTQEPLMYPSDRRYTKDHEWVSISGSQGRMGVTDYAQKQLGDVVFVELPEAGRTVMQGQACGTIESVKAVSELFSPVSGNVLEVNPVVSTKPETVNADPHGTWLIVIELSNPKEVDALLTSDQYAELVK